METSVCIRAEGLCKKYKGFELKEVSLTLEKGFIMGIVGKNGAGKSTLLRLLSGTLSPAKGEVYVEGEKVTTRNNKKKQQIALITEDRTFFESLSLIDNADLFGKLYERYDRNYFLRQLNRFHLDCDKKVFELSKGMYTKFQLAFSLSFYPEVLLLDEPTGGLDPIFRREFLYILQSLVEEEKKSIILSSHITSDLDKVADYILLLDEGKVIENQTKEAITDKYRLIKGPMSVFNLIDSDVIVGARQQGDSFEALVYREKQITGRKEELQKIVIEQPELSDILYYATSKKNLVGRGEHHVVI